MDSKEDKFSESERSTGDDDVEDPKLEKIQAEVDRSRQLFQEDEKQLTRFLPEEVWRAVLGNLKEDHLQNCANSSLFFRELGRDHLKIDLFPKVVEIMAPLFEERNFEIHIAKNAQLNMENYKAYENREFRTAAKNAVKKWKTAVLNCRLVCSAWNKAVEKCYERPEMTAIPEFVQHLDITSPLVTMHFSEWRMLHYMFDPYDETRNTVRDFLKHFEESHGSGMEAAPKNPFFGRAVFIQLGFEPLLTLSQTHKHRFMEFIKILELFGGEIWYCSLAVTVDNVELPSEDLATHLHLLLSHMPNLKFLKLQDFYFERYLPKDMFAQSPLPKLNKLEILNLHFVPFSIATELIRRNGHIKFLNNNYSEEIDVDVGSTLINLRGYTTLGSDDGERILMRFGREWNLNSIKISPILNTRPFQLFQLLEHVGAQSLTEVYLDKPFHRGNFTVLLQSKTCRLNLPKVKRLSISTSGCFFMDFALPMKESLEHLTIYQGLLWDPTEHGEWFKREQTIELVGFTEKMHLSNIWNVFPKLRTIKIFCCDGKTDLLCMRDGSKVVYKGHRFYGDVLWK